MLIITTKQEPKMGYLPGRIWLRPAYDFPCYVDYQVVNISTKTRKEVMMGGLLPFGGLIVGIITVVAGVIVLIWPRIIAYIIGIYLIIVGALAVIAAL